MTIAAFVFGYALSWFVARAKRRYERRMRFYMIKRRRAGRDARERAIQRAEAWLVQRQRQEDLSNIAALLWSANLTREISE